MGTKLRIYRVAKEFDVANDTLINFLKEKKYDVRNHMSPVSDEMYAELQKKFRKKEVQETEYDFRKSLKEKQVRESARKAEEQRLLQERLKAATQYSEERAAQKAESKRSEKEKTAVAKSEPKPKKAEHRSVEAFVEDKQAKSAAEKPAKAPEAKTIPEKTTVQPKAKTAPKAAEKTAPKARKKSATGTKAPETGDTSKRAPEAAKKTHAKPAARRSDDRDKKSGSKDSGRGHDKTRSQKPGGKTDKKYSPHGKKDDKKDQRQGGGSHSAKKTHPGQGNKNTRDHKRGEKNVGNANVKTDAQKKRRKKKRRVKISEAEVQQNIKKTMATLDGTASRSKKRRRRVHNAEDVSREEIIETNVIGVNEFISVAELAQAMEVESNDVIKACLKMGMLVSINQRLDRDVMEMLADEFGFEIEILAEYGQDKLDELEEEIEEEGNLEPRPPVVTIMGHVDHGKTSLLDFIRETNVIAGEAGGITQHIGAYEVKVNGKPITFLDTPGHEAFTAMRARGAQITDIVVLIVAADDAVMPQTIEAINHAQAAEVPIIVAINKIDKQNANVDMIKKQLAEKDVLIEEWGGKYQSAEISAKLGDGVDRLLELILLEADLLELKANAKRYARGAVLEGRLDKGKGVVATVLVQTGTLKVGDPFVVGQYHGKVRALYNERNQRVESAGPSVPVQAVGFSGLPSAGDQFVVLTNEKDTREIANKRQQLKREHELRQMKHITLDELSRRIKQGGVKDLNIIVKGDMGGSVEALSESLMKLSNDEVVVNVIHKGVGAISESDVLLAAASDAIIIGFQVRISLQARELSKRESVDIRQYRVIYDAIAEVKSALEGLLDPEEKEETRGTVEVRQVFKVPKVGTVAGSYVVSGKIARNDLVKLYRDDKLIFDGRVDSLRRFKDDAKEVSAGFECGIGLKGFDDIKVGDIMEPYKVIEIKRTLSA